MIASRLSKIKPSPTLAMTSKALELKAKGVNVISLSAGEPDFGTPANIMQAAKDAMDRGETKYTAVDGSPTLKKAIQEKFARENNLQYDLNQISVGAGGKQVLFNALFASINEGDEVIIPAPYWVSYIDIVALADGKPVVVEGLEQNHFKITPEQLESAITPKTKWFILNSPSNPSGATYSQEELKGLAKVLLDHPHVMIMSDDIYEHIVYDGLKFFTIAQVEPKLKPRVFTLNGVSKSYSMTGWRIGYGAGPAELVKAMCTLQSQSTTNPCSISQAAAAEALNGPQDYIPKNAHLFQKRRDLVVGMINDIPLLKCLMPTGAFYVFPNCKEVFGKQTPSGKVIENSNDFCEYLLESHSVATVQGSAFGMEGYFRISYATSEALIKEACERIKTACEQLK